MTLILESITVSLWMQMLSRSLLLSFTNDSQGPMGVQNSGISKHLRVGLSNIAMRRKKITSRVGGGENSEQSLDCFIAPIKTESPVGSGVHPCGGEAPSRALARPVPSSDWSIWIRFSSSCTAPCGPAKGYGLQNNTKKANICQKL